LTKKGFTSSEFVVNYILKHQGERSWKTEAVFFHKMELPKKKFFHTVPFYQTTDKTIFIDPFPV
jgi:hypothetical protein